MNSKLISTIIATVLFLNVYSQAEVVEEVSNGFLGVSSGVNNMNGILGITGEARLVKNVSVFAAAGIGGWGTKASIGAKYYRNYPYGTHFGISYSGAGGLKDFKTTVDTEPEGSKEVTMDLKKAHDINLIIGYNWKLFKRSRLHLEFGYSVPLEDKPYEITSGDTLSKDGETYMEIMAPGGIIAGIGFSVGL